MNYYIVDRVSSASNKLAQLYVSGPVFWSFLFLFWLAFSMTAATATPPSEIPCPKDVAIVDLGRWEKDTTGELHLMRGGLLVNVKQENENGPVFRSTDFTCRDAVPLSLDLQVDYGLDFPVIKYLGFSLNSFSQWAGAGVVQMPSAAIAKAVREDDWLKTWDGWKLVARSTDQTSSEPSITYVVGQNYECFFNSDNPTLSGDGDYGCLATIEGMPHPNTFFRCVRWGAVNFSSRLTTALRFPCVTAHREN